MMNTATMARRLAKAIGRDLNQRRRVGGDDDGVKQAVQAAGLDVLHTMPLRREGQQGDVLVHARADGQDIAIWVRNQGRLAMVSILGEEAVARLATHRRLTVLLDQAEQASAMNRSAAWDDLAAKLPPNLADEGIGGEPGDAARAIELEAMVARRLGQAPDVDPAEACLLALRGAGVEWLLWERVGSIQTGEGTEPRSIFACFARELTPAGWRYYAFQVEAGPTERPARALVGAELMQRLDGYGLL